MQVVSTITFENSRKASTFVFPVQNIRLRDKPSVILFLQKTLT
jgi:hypothetical protein